MPTKERKVTKRHAAWTNKKYSKRTYSGHYDSMKGERVFVLSTMLKNGKQHNVAFESHEAAKKSGWARK